MAIPDHPKQMQAITSKLRYQLTLETSIHHFALVHSVPETVLEISLLHNPQGSVSERTSGIVVPDLKPTGPWQSALSITEQLYL